MIEITDEMREYFNNELWDINIDHPEWEQHTSRVMKRIIELHEANKPKPEPVGYGLVIKGVLHATKDEAGSVGFVPLYITPPTREPLTPQEVSKILFECRKGTTMFWNFAKAVEQAHGIGTPHEPA